MTEAQTYNSVNVEHLEWEVAGTKQEQREDEVRRRAEAEVNAGNIVPGSGTRGKPRRMAQMVSLRLDGETIGFLSVLAKCRNMTLSALVREAVKDMLRRSIDGAP